MYVPYNAVHSPYQPPNRPLPAVTKEGMYDGDRQVYAAMLEKVDEGVGLLLAELEKQGVLDNTLFVLSSDNGVSTKSTGDAALGPNLAVSASRTAFRRTAGSSASVASATAPNVKDAITPGVPERGEESSVTSATDPGPADWPLKPPCRQNASS